MSGYRLLLATTVLVGLVCTTHAQDPALRAEVQRWHERLFGSKTAVSVADGRQAREQIARWNLDRKTLDAEVRGELLRLEIIAALAVGDAGYAVKHAAELGREFPALQSTRRATWLAAVAAGDAALARQTLEQLKEGGATKDKAIAVRLARLQRVGHAAPDRTVTTAGGPPMALRQRQGVVLLIDFWSVREPPADRQVEALRQLVATYKAEGQVAFLGVNTDAAEDVEAARKLAADKGYTWPQFYEQSTGAGRWPRRSALRRCRGTSSSTARATCGRSERRSSPNFSTPCGRHSRKPRRSTLPWPRGPSTGRSRPVRLANPPMSPRKRTRSRSRRSQSRRTIRRRPGCSIRRGCT